MILKVESIPPLARWHSQLRSGWLTMNEIYNGLMRLRGPVAKTEIVGFCDLDAGPGISRCYLDVTQRNGLEGDHSFAHGSIHTLPLSLLWV